MINGKALARFASEDWAICIGFPSCGALPPGLLDYGLEEGRGEETGELAVGGGGGHGQGSAVGVAGGLFECRLPEGRACALSHDRYPLQQRRGGGGGRRGWPRSSH